MRLKNVPIDFLSWHTYSKNIEDFTRREIEVRNALDTYGYTNTESILNEWNYLVTWENLLETQQNIRSINGAALTSAVMCVMQNTSLDMLMYYSIQPGTWNGAFDYYTLKKLKAFYVFLMFSKLYKLQTQIDAQTDDKEIYVTAAANEKSIAAMITYYTCDDNAVKKTVTVDVSDTRPAKAYILDKENDMKYIRTVSEKTNFVLEPNSVLFLSDE